MTKFAQKRQEEIFAMTAARLLRQRWQLSIGMERPDFIVRNGRQSFGLELTEIDHGAQRQSRQVAGREHVPLREYEGRRTKLVQQMRRSFEAERQDRVSIRVVGDVQKTTTDLALGRLLALPLRDAQVGSQFVFTVDPEDTSCGLLKVYVTKSIRPLWVDVGSQVGWINQTPGSFLQAAIDKKAGHLLEYQRNCGSDVRLLVIANGYRGSGKFTIENVRSIDTEGFRSVYFLLYPDALAVFDARLPYRRRLISSRR